MHVFVTGGSGQTGPAIVTELIAAGHSVTGLARSNKAVARLSELGANVLSGSLDDVELLHKALKLPTASFTWPSAATSRSPRV